MFDFLRNIPETFKGIGLVVFGTILIVHTFGIFRQRLDVVIVLVGCIMILYGFIILNGSKKITKIVEQITRKKDDSA
ncbi:hypothetical protein KC460_03845 [Candidatus Dependentiae bacterium]|nr:hypothetical protein [Candidatus Dependentiae bacterium]